MHEADAWAREVPLIAFDDALAHYEEHGYARLGQVLPDRMRAALVVRADDLMLGRVTHEGLFFQHDAESGRYHDLAFGAGYVGPSLRYRKIEKLEKDPIFRAWIENPLFERIARARIEGDLAIYRAALFGKAASGSSALPFHQDGGSFWGLSRDPELQIWTALDDAGEDAGCLEVVPGSHRFGLATPLGGLIPEHVVAEQGVESKIVRLPARAGEAILLHNYLWHRSGENRSGAPRRGFTVCYMSAETRCLRKKRTPRSFVRVFEPTSGTSSE
jgi:hypothetical protein